MPPKPAPQNHAVVIMDDGTSCRITPAETLAAKRDSVTFSNLTAGKITVMLPDITIFGKTSFDLAKSESLPLPFSKDAQKGIYTFTVYCDHIKEFAHASVPRIIIYDDLV